MTIPTHPVHKALHAALTEHQNRHDRRRAEVANRVTAMIEAQAQAVTK